MNNHMCTSPKMLEVPLWHKTEIRFLFQVHILIRTPAFMHWNGKGNINIIPNVYMSRTNRTCWKTVIVRIKNAETAAVYQHTSLGNDIYLSRYLLRTFHKAWSSDMYVRAGSVTSNEWMLLELIISRKSASRLWPRTIGLTCKWAVRVLFNLHARCHCLNLRV